MRTKEQDPTNLYIANLPLTFTEKHLEEMLQYYGNVISTRILRDNAGISRGVGFARMEKTEICEKVIKDFNNKLLPGCKEALLVKFADSSSRRKKITGAWGAAAAAAAIAAGVDPRSAGAELFIGYDHATQAAAAAAAAALMQQNALGTANPFVSSLFPRYSISQATQQNALAAAAAAAAATPAAQHNPAATSFYPAAAHFTPPHAPGSVTPSVATSTHNGSTWINPHATQYYLPTGSQFLPAHASPEAALYGLSQAPPSGALPNPYAPAGGNPQQQQQQQHQQHAAHLANAGAPVAHLYGAVASGFMPTSSIATYAAAAAASPQGGTLQTTGQLTGGTPTSVAE